MLSGTVPGVGGTVLLTGKFALLHALDVPAVLLGGLLQQLGLLRGALQGVGADQPGRQQRQGDQCHHRREQAGGQESRRQPDGGAPSATVSPPP